MPREQYWLRHACCSPSGRDRIAVPRIAATPRKRELGYRELVSVMSTVVPELLHGRHGEYRRPCPQCDRGPRDAALCVRVDDRGVTWYCHRCHYKGGANGSRVARISAGHAARSARPAADIPFRWSERAESLWRCSVPLRDTIGEVYLRARMCVIPPVDGDLRFLPSSANHRPCLLAKVTDFVTNEPLSLHFTKLKRDGSGKAGTERDKFLLKGHQKKGGVIRLWPDDSVTLSLCLSEGIESALSAARLHTPVWSTVDAGNLGDLPVVEGIEELLVFADHDAAGVTAARKIVTRWRRAGRRARAWMPSQDNLDPNDVVRGAA